MVGIVQQFQLGLQVYTVVGGCGEDDAESNTFSSTYTDEGQVLMVALVVVLVRLFKWFDELDPLQHLLTALSAGE